MLSYEARKQEERLLKSIEYREERVKRLEVLRKGASSPFWKALKADLEISIKTVQAQMDNLAEGNVELENEKPGDFKVAQRFWAGHKRAYKGTVSDVEQAEDKIERINAEINEEKELLRQIRNSHKAEELTGTMPKARSVI